MDFYWLKIKTFFNSPENRQLRALFRVLLCFYLVWYFPLPDTAAVKGPQDTFFAASSTGIGGGFAAEQISLNMEVPVMELDGIPEPEEYSKPRMLSYSAYKVVAGDMIGFISKNAGLNEDTLLSVNDIKDSRRIQIGQVLKIPNQDGINYKVKKGDTLASIAEKHEVDPGAISVVNELFSEELKADSVLFIPGARLDWVNRQEINGDLFIWPVTGWVTSPYGIRVNPFGGDRQFHSGLDIGASSGAPVKAAMAGRVSMVGYNDTFGNYIVISHHSGYRTLYAHLNIARVKMGAYVGTGQRIGDVGSTGLSTGPHLHFTVYKNGLTVNPRTLMK
jgi:murein DD-endopeptidase MepM/ murein hydrolase activator NlpD